MDAMADVPAGGDLAPDAVVELVLRALSGRVDPAALQAAREEGYRQGHAEGRAEADGAWRARLAALIGGQAEATAVAQVAAPAAAEMADNDDDAPAIERVTAGLEVLAQTPEPETAASERGAWKTAAREALLRQLWPDFERSVRAIRLSLRGLPGPAVPDSEPPIYSWAKALGLGPRSGGRGTAVLAAANAARGVRAAQARVDAAMPVGDAPAAEAEDAPVAPLPEGEMRETPGLKRARELLAMGLHPNDVAAAVRLTAMEMAAVRREHAGLPA